MIFPVMNMSAPECNPFNDATDKDAVYRVTMPTYYRNYINL
jgi:hypothetical protein